MLGGGAWSGLRHPKSWWGGSLLQGEHPKTPPPSAFPGSGRPQRLGQNLLGFPPCTPQISALPKPQSRPPMPGAWPGLQSPDAFMTPPAQGVGAALAPSPCWAGAVAGSGVSLPLCRDGTCLFSFCPYFFSSSCRVRPIRRPQQEPGALGPGPALLPRHGKGCGRESRSCPLGTSRAENGHNSCQQWRPWGRLHGQVPPWQGTA